MRWSSSQLARLVLYGLGLHVLLLIAAALTYPGGSWWDPKHLGFDLVHNFWCDLLRPHSHSGVDNPWGSLCARGALLTLAVVLALFWPLVGKRYALSPRRQWLLTVAGWCGCVAVVAVALATGLRQALHDWSILLLGPVGAGALVWAVALGIRRGSPLVRALGMGAAVFSLWNLGQYFRQKLLESESWSGLPLVQRTATVFVLAWIAAVAASAVTKADPIANRWDS